MQLFLTKEEAKLVLKALERNMFYEPSTEKVCNRLKDRIDKCLVRQHK